MTKAKRNLAAAPSPYERDFVAWTEQQADLLRRAAAREPTSDLDLRNLAEEIEAWANATAERGLRRSPYHRASIGAPARTSPGVPCRLGELGRRAPLESAKDPRGQPGLKAELATILMESYDDGRRRAARSLRD
jgi:uncharacterized protein DUF29